MPFLPHVTAFVDRWTEKRERYGTEELDDCFDRFFTSFVIYNFLYGEITKSMHYNLAGDRDQATKVPKKYLGADFLHRNEALRSAAATISRQLESEQFILKSSKADKDTLIKLNSNDPQQWSLGIMEAAYQVRCNTFHGAKDFKLHQREILRPCIMIIEIVSKLILEKEEAQDDGDSAILRP